MHNNGDLVVNIGVDIVVNISIFVEEGVEVEDDITQSIHR